MQVKVDAIKSNPYRNFDKYPIDQEHVDVLKATIKRSGMWKNLEGRKGPSGNGSVEIAYGHHRIEAAKQLGIKQIDISIVKLSEDQMIDRMVTENTTQRGHSTVAVYDSVRAIMKRLAYILLANNWDEGGNKCSHLFTKQSFVQSKEKLQAGEGLGKRIIHRYNDSLALREIRDAISAMKDTGEVKAVLQEVSDRLASEAEQKRLAAEKLSEKKAKEKAEAEAAAERIKAKKAAEATTRQPEATVDGEALLLFPTTHKADAFRQLVQHTHGDGTQIIPVEKHVELAELLIKQHDKWNPEKKGAKYISTNFIRDFISPILRTGKLTQYAIDREQEAKAIQHNIFQRADRHIRAIISHTKDTQWHVQEFGKILKTNGEITDDIPKLARVPFELQKTIEGLEKLKNQFEKLV